MRNRADAQPEKPIVYSAFFCGICERILHGNNKKYF